MKRFLLVLTLVVLVVTISGCATLPFNLGGCKNVIKPKEKIVLFNGKDFTGWVRKLKDPNVDVDSIWSVKDGILYCTGAVKGYIRTEAKYADYFFHVEYRWPEKGGNSGVLAHMQGPDNVWPKSIECQMLTGKAGDFLVIGTGEKYLKNIQIEQRAKGGPRVEVNQYVNNRRVRKLKDSSEKPIGEWNTYEVLCMDDWIVVLVNGVLQNVATKSTLTCGSICLQSELTPVEFRNIYVEPVDY